jgi:hypothetical protein
MAHQLEAALRRPVHAEAPKPAETQRIEPKLAPPPRPAPAAKPPAAAAAAAAAPTVPTPQKQPFESIEQEMANLLGRSGKT